MKKLLVIATTVALSGCLGTLLTPSYTPEIKWKEEVKLHDGRVIVVDRESRREGRAVPGEAPFEGVFIVRAKHPDTGEEILWNEFAGGGPEVIDFVNGVPYFAVNVGSGPSCRKYQFPKLNFVFFKYDKRWQRISFEELPKELDTNLFISAWHAERVDMLDSFMTLDKKAIYNKRHGYDSALSMRERMQKNKYSRCADFLEAKKHQS